MLGVLAIIGVLSVGGIAGYSKAMEKFKINKVITEYIYLIQGLKEYADNIRYSTEQFDYTELATSLNLIPQSWSHYDSGTLIQDELGHPIRLTAGDGHFTLEIYLLTSYDNKLNTNRLNFCRELFSNLAVPLQESVITARIWRPGFNGIIQYGTQYCTTERNCLSNLTPVQIDELCKSVETDNDGGSFVLNF